MRTDNKKFLIAMIVLAVVEFLRFFDHELLFHSAPMGILQGYGFSQVVLAVYYIAVFAFFYMFLSQMPLEFERDMRYLIVFLSVFLYPMFCQKNYFGTMDVVAALCFILEIMMICENKGKILIPVLGLIGTCLAPMSLLTFQIYVFVFLVYEGTNKNRKDMILAAGHIMLSVLAVLVSVKMGYFMTDGMYVLTLKKFVVTCLLFLPYAWLMVKYMRDVLLSAKNKALYLLLFMGGLPGVIAYGLLADYSRVIFYGFVYYLILICFLLIQNDNCGKNAYQNLRMWIMEHVPFAGIIVAYPFVVMCFWISGPLELFEETFIGL